MSGIFMIGLLTGFIIGYPAGWYIRKLSEQERKQKQKSGNNSVQIQITRIGVEENNEENS